MARSGRRKRRPKAQTPKGFRDYFGDEAASRSDMLGRIAEVYRLYGFEPLETPAIETVDALGKFLPDSDRPNEGVFAWKSKEDQWLALRYDLTAPLSRVAAQFRNVLPFPYRRYAMGPVWRNEKPGPGRFRQFYQCDADTVGSASLAADAEICAMGAAALEAAGVPRGRYIFRINSRKILDSVLALTSVVDDDAEEAGALKRLRVLRAIDKLDRLGAKSVRALLTGGRKDRSGDFAEGAGLSDGQADQVMAFLSAKQADGAQTCARLRTVVSGSDAGQAAIDEVESILEHLDIHGIGPGQAEPDPSVVRGLGYYTGAVFEAELNQEIKDRRGRAVRIGSVAGGGRYDGLVRRFTGQDVPATGISIGVDRLAAALAAAKHPDSIGEQGPVLITVMDRDRMNDYQRMAVELRNAGIRAEVFLGNARNFGRQLKYADQRKSPVAIIEGTDERREGVVQIKDLELGARLAQSSTYGEWKARPSQFAVRREDLVGEVGRLLARAQG